MTAQARRILWVVFTAALIALTSACMGTSEENKPVIYLEVPVQPTSAPKLEYPVVVFVTSTPEPFQREQRASEATASAEQISATSAAIQVQQTQAAQVATSTQIAVDAQSTVTAFTARQTQAAFAEKEMALTATAVAIKDRKQAEVLKGETGLMLGFSGGTAFFLLAIAVVINMAQSARREETQAETALVEKQRQAMVQQAYLQAQVRADERLAEARRKGAEAIAAQQMVEAQQRAAAQKLVAEQMDAIHRAAEKRAAEQKVAQRAAQQDALRGGKFAENRQAGPQDEKEPWDKAIEGRKNGDLGTVQNKDGGFDITL